MQIPRFDLWARAAREKAGLTREELCKKIDVSCSYLCKIENARTVPNMNAVEDIGEVCGADLAELDPRLPNLRGYMRGISMGISGGYIDLEDCAVAAGMAKSYMHQTLNSAGYKPFRTRIMLNTALAIIEYAEWAEKHPCEKMDKVIAGVNVRYMTNDERTAFTGEDYVCTNGKPDDAEAAYQTLEHAFRNACIGKKPRWRKATTGERAFLTCMEGPPCDTSPAEFGFHELAEDRWAWETDHYLCEARHYTTLLPNGREQGMIEFRAFFRSDSGNVTPEPTIVKRLPIMPRKKIKTCT